MPNFIPDIPFSSLQYDLPEGRIAAKPLEQRDASRLLEYRNGTVTDHVFRDLTGLLPAGTMLVGNNTRVIPARLLFPKESGTVVEVFLLTPLNADWTIWKAMVGNRRKFRDGESLAIETVHEGRKLGLSVAWYHRDSDIVRLDSLSGQAIHDLVEMLGKVPLPPYIKRAADEQDKSRYQTVFAQVPGAVAAPTASLHFTPELMDQLSARGFGPEFLTLHVSAGTFKPVTSTHTSGHEMHHEHYTITADLIQKLIQQISSGGRVVPIGTTSMRVLESLYYLGFQLSRGDAGAVNVGPDAGFSPHLQELDTLEALRVLLGYAQEHGGSVSGHTSVFILPGFPFRICHGIITNFHQPGSTLIALVAGFIGENWKKVYAHALNSGYRFLSYGDSSLLWRV